MKKSLFIDLDGTLLQPDFLISKVNIACLKKALDVGFNVILISGRPILFVEYFARLIDDRVASIGFNGAYCEDVLDFTLDQNTLKKINDIVKRYDFLAMLKSIDHIYANRQVNEHFAYKINEEVQAKCTLNADLDSLNNHSIYKYIGMFKGKPINEIVAIEKEFNALDVNYIDYNKKGFEVSHVNASKGQAIKYYCKHYDYDLDKVVCIGDSVNDVSMFELGCFNVVMGNAEESIKKYASFVTLTCTEDGVAYALEKILKGEIA